MNLDFIISLLFIQQIARSTHLLLVRWRFNNLDTILGSKEKASSSILFERFQNWNWAFVSQNAALINTPWNPNVFIREKASREAFELEQLHVSFVTDISWILVNLKKHTHTHTYESKFPTHSGMLINQPVKSLDRQRRRITWDTRRRVSQHIRRASRKTSAHDFRFVIQINQLYATFTNAS